MSIKIESKPSTSFKQQLAELCPSKKRHYTRRKKRLCKKLSPHEQGVLDSLKIYGNEHLYGTTLLDKKVHARQAKALYRRAADLFGLGKPKFRGNASFGFASKYGYFESEAHQKLRKTLRAITIIHSVEQTKERTFENCMELKSLLKHTLSKFKGAQLIGSFEVEMYPIHLACKFRQHLLDTSSRLEEFADPAFEDDEHFRVRQFRKLENCINLAHRASINVDELESSVFLVHFHGLINAKDIDQLNEIESTLKHVERWSAVPRQVLLKAFHTPNERNQRQLEDEVWTWCEYSTKMGKLKNGNYSYLRYNIDVPTAFEDSLLGSNFDHKCMYLTPYEINEMYVLTAELMNTTKQRNGHIVRINNGES